MAELINTDMDFGTLIHTVESNKCLYNKQDKNYKNLIVKEAAWDEIAEIADMSKDECRKRWNLLREKFNKELKKRDLPSGSGTPYDDEWAYMESMMFLKPFIQHRKTKSNSFIEAGFENESQSESCSTENETPTPKKQKLDHFAETCNLFQVAIDEFREMQKNLGQPQPTPSVDADDHFLATIKELMKGLPAETKDQARIDVLTYFSTLRTQHLGN